MSLTYEEAKKIVQAFNQSDKEMGAAVMAGWLLAGDGVKAAIAQAFIDGYELHRKEVKLAGGMG